MAKVIHEEVLEWAIDYEAIIRAHLARQPTLVRPAAKFVIPMSFRDWEQYISGTLP
jgi:hypothetical protein